MSEFVKVASTYYLDDDNYNYSYSTSYSTLSPPQARGPGIHAYWICRAHHDDEFLALHLVNKIMPNSHIVEPFIFIYLQNIYKKQ